MRKYSRPMRLDSRNLGRNLTRMRVSWILDDRIEDGGGEGTYKVHFSGAERVMHFSHVERRIRVFGVDRRIRSI